MENYKEDDNKKLLKIEEEKLKILKEILAIEKEMLNLVKNKK